MVTGVLCMTLHVSGQLMSFVQRMGETFVAASVSISLFKSVDPVVYLTFVILMIFYSKEK